jgi:hypothetical protein
MSTPRMVREPGIQARELKVACCSAVSGGQRSSAIHLDTAPTDSAYLLTGSAHLAWIARLSQVRSKPSLTWFGNETGITLRFQLDYNKLAGREYRPPVVLIDDPQRRRRGLGHFDP